MGLLVLGATAAVGHDADLLYVRLSQTTDGSLYERITLTASALALLAPVDVDGDGALTPAELDSRKAAIGAGVWGSVLLTAGGLPCPFTDTGASMTASAIELTAVFRCPPGELRQRFAVLSVLPTGFRVVLDVDRFGSKSQHIAEGNAQTVVLVEGPAAAEATFFGWVKLGLEHILTGLDHLAFVIALLLGLPGWRRVLAMVSAFTVAHSLTLASTTMGWWVPGPVAQRWVEMAIAASIVAVAAENLLRREPRHRAAVAFGFGLIHGLGFAGALVDHGLGSSAARALLGFNLGVELGQAAVVLSVLPVLRAARRWKGAGPRALRAGSVLLLAAGLAWLVARLVD